MSKFVFGMSRRVVQDGIMLTLSYPHPIFLVPYTWCTESTRASHPSPFLPENGFVLQKEQWCAEASENRTSTSIRSEDSYWNISLRLTFWVVGRMSVSRKNILLYEGEGSSEQSVRMALHTFKYLLENTTFSVQKICPELILEGNCKHYAVCLWKKSDSVFLTQHALKENVPLFPVEKSRKDTKCPQNYTFHSYPEILINGLLPNLR